MSQEVANKSVLYEKMFLNISQNTHENNFIKKETLAQVFSRQLCKIFKNTSLTGHLRMTASDVTRKLSWMLYYSISWNSQKFRFLKIISDISIRRICQENISEKIRK